MKWYYASGKEKKGPVDDDALSALVESGEVSPETLVWHEGLPAWKAYSEVGSGGGGDAGESGEGDGGMVRCAYSGEMRAKVSMLQYGDKWVAAEHKESFVQALQQDELVGTHLQRIVEGIMQRAIADTETAGDLLGRDHAARVTLLVRPHVGAGKREATEGHRCEASGIGTALSRGGVGREAIAPSADGLIGDDAMGR